MINTYFPPISHSQCNFLIEDLDGIMFESIILFTSHNKENKDLGFKTWNTKNWCRFLYKVNRTEKLMFNEYNRINDECGKTIMQTRQGSQTIIVICIVTALAWKKIEGLSVICVQGSSCLRMFLGKVIIITVREFLNLQNP